MKEVLELIRLQTEYGISFDKNMIYISGELHEHTGLDLRLRYNILNEYYKFKNNGEKLKEINLEISSFGGSIYSINAALDFYEEMTNEGVTVNGTTSSICMSAATILLSGIPGKRTATKRAKFMLHDLQIGGVDGTANQIKNIGNQLDKDQLELFCHYVEFSNRGIELDPKEKIKEAKKMVKKYCSNNEDSYLCSEDILKLKLIDEII